MIDRLLALPAHVRERLAGALETALLSAPYSSAALHSVLGAGARVQDVAEVMKEFERIGVPPVAAAAWIRSVERASGNATRPDLVWSGPEVSGLNARDTRRVYEELIGSAKRTLWASTYAFFDGPRAFEPLARRMDAVAELNVTLLLNIQRRRGDVTAPDRVVRRFADRFWTADWPGSRKPNVFYDPRSLDVEGPTGVLHAKAVVADDLQVFLTSANLTEAALDRNIELGLLVRDAPLAASVTRHFQVLIERGLLHCLPQA